jgi:GT2 family glycosyltransferase
LKISAVVISHGHARELEHSLPALAPQVDELLVIANVKGSIGALPEGARVVENPRPLSFAANANGGFAATTGDVVLLANPDAVPDPDAVGLLAGFMAAHPRAGVVGPQLRYPDGTWQPARRRFPTVAGTIVRRTPIRLLYPPFERQKSHYYLDERPDEPVPTESMLGAFMLIRRETIDELGGFDPGYRMYGEDIDFCYRAAKAGWERWHVPAAIVTHEYAAEIDKRFWTVRNLWHFRAMLRFVRKHPERLKAVV